MPYCLGCTHVRLERRQKKRKKGLELEFLVFLLLPCCFCLGGGGGRERDRQTGEGKNLGGSTLETTSAAMEVKMNNYGLQLRVQPSEQKKAKQLRRPPSIFADDDGDDNVGSEIARQATKNKLLKDIEELHKKALEEDPSVFDYDGVYEKVKEETVRPLAHDRQERKSKYIHRLTENANERKRDHEIVYERKLAKERSKDDHLFADKDKFVTSAYKKKLAEQAKWLEEERLRLLREEKDDVTKKSDMSDFYFNLTKNVAFGAKVCESSMPVEKEEKSIACSPKEEFSSNVGTEKEKYRVEVSTQLETIIGPSDMKPLLNTSLQGSIAAEQPSTEQSKPDFHKKGEDALSAAKERFVARKRAKQL